jgi:hypothetical protein
VPIVKNNTDKNEKVFSVFSEIVKLSGQNATYLVPAGAFVIFYEHYIEELQCVVVSVGHGTVRNYSALWCDARTVHL